MYITTQGNDLAFNPALGINESNSIVSLFNNYPNPASSSTIFNFRFTSQPQNASINIYNMDGALIHKIDINKQNKVSFSVSNIKSGIYFYSLIADGKVLAVNKLVVTH